MPVALAISPHLDDAAFSCGGTLAVLAERGWSVTVATVFTRSFTRPRGFALACQLDKGLDAEVDYMALRRAEDGTALGSLGVAARWLDLPEAPHRGYESAPALFGEVLASDRVQGEVEAAIGRCVAELGPQLVLGPQGIGGHVDHVVVVRAMTRVLEGLPVAWWRDFPYVARDGEARMPFEAIMAGLEEVSVPVSLARKEAACAGYATQLGFQFGGREGLRTALVRAGCTERLRSGDEGVAGALRTLAT